MKGAERGGGGGGDGKPIMCTWNRDKVCFFLFFLLFFFPQSATGGERHVADGTRNVQLYCGYGARERGTFVQGDGEIAGTIESFFLGSSLLSLLLLVCVCVSVGNDRLFD